MALQNSWMCPSVADSTGGSNVLDGLWGGLRRCPTSRTGLGGMRSPHTLANRLFCQCPFLMDMPFNRTHLFGHKAGSAFEFFKESKATNISTSIKYGLYITFLGSTSPASIIWQESCLVQSLWGPMPKKFYPHESLECMWKKSMNDIS